MKTSLNRLREEMRAVARGERTPPPLPAASVLSVLASAGNLELLRIIASERPESISRLAEHVGRAQPNISRALQQLLRYGLIRLVREGKEVRPELAVAEIDIDLKLGTYRALPARNVIA
jgi:predicted transcriptional regulator